jgi:hypothetical protein
MKSYQVIIIILIILSACKHQNRQLINPETASYEINDTIYYRYLVTNKMIKDSAMQSFVDSLKKHTLIQTLKTARLQFSSTMLLKRKIR